MLAHFPLKWRYFTIAVIFTIASAYHRLSHPYSTSAPIWFQSLLTHFQIKVFTTFYSYGNDYELEVLMISAWAEVGALKYSNKSSCVLADASTSPRQFRDHVKSSKKITKRMMRRAAMLIVQVMVTQTMQRPEWQWERRRELKYKWCKWQ